MHSILFVDTEKTVLKMFGKLFANHNFNLYFATHGAQALKIMSENSIDMVVSDVRIPRMNGHNLLKEVQLLYPHTIRIIMSGTVDEYESHKAVLDGSAKIYLMKPLEPPQLLDVIPHLFEFKDMLASNNVLDIIDRIDNLPTVSDTYTKLCQLIETDADIDDIVAVINKDPAVSAKILQLINSAFFNKKIGSLKQAIIYLGFNTIKILVLSTNIFNYTSANSTPYFNRLFSQQAILTNKLLEFEYKAFFRKRLHENYMTAGLLHDIGMVLMQQHFSHKYINALKECSPEEQPFFTAESELFGVTHQAIGGYLLEWWGIPYPIVDSCLNHHTPLASSINRNLVCAVHLADYYAWNYLGRPDLAKLDERVFEVMGLDQQKCENLVNEALYNWETESIFNY